MSLIRLGGWSGGHTSGRSQPTSMRHKGQLEEARNLRPPGAPERYLYAGSSSEYHAPIRPGDVITSILTLSEVYERQGGLGLMLFYVVEERMTKQNGELVRVFKSNNILY